MTDASDRELILLSLRDRPSVASAIAIGHYHVLNGAPARIALLALDALERMPCDWTVVILEQTALRGRAHPSVRRMAVRKICRLLAGAIERGYGRISVGQVRCDACTLLARPRAQEKVLIHLASQVELPRSYADELRQIVRREMDDPELHVSVIVVRGMWRSDDDVPQASSP